MKLKVVDNKHIMLSSEYYFVIKIDQILEYWALEIISFYMYISGVRFFDKI